MTDLSAILITHQHPDHVDTARLPALCAANPNAVVYADPQTAALLGPPCHAIQVGDEVSLGELTIRAVGGKHAVIHSDIPVIDNVSYLVGDAEHPARLMHPGDALFVPNEPVDVLAAPATAPWMSIAQTIDYLRAVAPARTVPIHQGLIVPEARAVFYTMLKDMTDTDFQVLPEERAVTF